MKNSHDSSIPDSTKRESQIPVHQNGSQAQRQRSDQRQFMAEVVKGLGLGGQSLAERELGWNRRTIRKGMRELTSGQAIEDGYQRSGRKRVEAKLPHLLEDIRALVDPQAQTDPSFKSTRLL